MLIKFRLKEIMEEKGMKIKDLNEKTGISRNSLSLLINGKSQGVQFDTIEKILNALGVEIHDLFVQTFDFVSIKIIGQSIQTKMVEKEYKYVDPASSEKDVGNNNIPRDSKDVKKEFVLRCVLNIDGIERIYYFPYRIVIAFYPNPVMKIELNIKEVDDNNQLSYLFKKFILLEHLFNYYVINKVFEYNYDFIKKISENFNMEHHTVFLISDGPTTAEEYKISITQKNKVNKKKIYEIISMLNKYSSHVFFSEDSIIIKSRNKIIE